VGTLGVVQPGIVSSAGDSSGGVRGGGAAAASAGAAAVVVAAAVAAAAADAAGAANVDAAVATPLGLSFNGSMASVTTSASACLSHSSSCLSLHVPMGLAWDIHALLRMGGETVGVGGR
jgi:hypothetical protein